MKLGGKADLNSLDYECFNKFLVNLAYFCYSKPPKDLRARGISTILDEFFRTIADANKKRGLSAAVFLDDGDT
jgi:hypothetical protein